MSGKLQVVRTFAANPIKRKKKKAKAQKRSRRKIAKIIKAPAPSKAREMILAPISGRNGLSHHEWWTGTGWSRQKQNGKKYRYREELEAAFGRASKEPPPDAYCVMTVPA